MGWCHEFGPQIHEGCNHPMVAGATSCSCDECGTICRGRFNGCSSVWERGPIAVRSARVLEPLVLAEASIDGRMPDDVLVPDFTLTSRPLVPVALPPMQLPAPAPTPAPVPIPPRKPVVVAPPKPLPRITRTLHPAPGLDGLRARLDGLRGELRSMGDALGARSER